ncbi:MAG: acetyl-CoA carboxylase, carboxyltransferase subunit beta [Candidatus Omnitrophota bacterium]
MALFRKLNKKTEAGKKKDIPGGLWVKCPACNDIIYTKTLIENFKVCSKCDYHFTIGAKERINLLVDKNSFKEYDENMTSVDSLEFKGPKSYKEKLEEDKKNTNLKSAALWGQAKINGKEIVVVATDSNFIMGSMGSVVGEKISRAFEKATELKLPIIVISGSGGGARMYEGMLSLMQMAKTSQAAAMHSQAQLIFISVLTNPTMAGVMASFASLGDIIIAEPKALIGFTGPRVIEQTIRQKLPESFQKSEFLLQHGLIDLIVHRKNLKQTLSRIVNYTN